MFRIVVKTGANLAVLQINIIYFDVIDSILDKMGGRLCNSDFSFLPMPLV